MELGPACVRTRALLALGVPVRRSSSFAGGDRLGETMATHEVLVLNSNYEPLNVCNMRRAVSLMLLGKAEVLQHREAPLPTVNGSLKAPSVLKMRYQVRRPMPQLRLSRHSVLARDNYTCQYCGVRG